VPHVAVGDPQPPGQPAGTQRPRRGVLLLLSVPELLNPLTSGRRAGAQLGELLADLPLVAAQLPRKRARTQPLAGADLAGPVVVFPLDRPSLGIGGAAGDRGVLVAAGGEVPLQPGELLRGRAAVAGWLAEHLKACPVVCWARSPPNHWRTTAGAVPTSAANSLGQAARHRPAPAAGRRR
jgi:hypothetical protein